MPGGDRDVGDQAPGLVFIAPVRMKLLRVTKRAVLQHLDVPSRKTRIEQLLAIGLCEIEPAGMLSEALSDFLPDLVTAAADAGADRGEDAIPRTVAWRPRLP